MTEKSFRADAVSANSCDKLGANPEQSAPKLNPPTRNHVRRDIGPRQSLLCAIVDVVTLSFGDRRIELNAVEGTEPWNG